MTVPDNLDKATVEALIADLRTFQEETLAGTSVLFGKAADALSRMAGEPRIVVRWEGGAAYVGPFYVGCVYQRSERSGSWRVECFDLRTSKADESTARAALVKATIEALTKGGA